MLQVTADDTVQLKASGDPFIIFKSGIRVFTRKNITVNSVPPEKDVTVNVAPPETLPNRQPKPIYSSSLICVKNVSLDKVPNRELTSTGIMTRSNIGLGHIPVKKNSCKQKNVYQMLETTKTLVKACQKIEV